MPTPSTSKWPRPKNEEEWEEMVLDAMRLRWNDPNAQRNGRRGQRQNGVDIFGRMGTVDVAAQAKNTDGITESEARQEILKAEQFKPPLAQFYFAIGGSRDAKFQEFIRLLSAERRARREFEVFILFFDDVCQELAKRQELVRKYYRSFLEELWDVLPIALAKSVLTTDDALSKIFELQEFKDLAVYIESASNGQVHANLRIEEKPDLEAPSETLERSWHLAIAENHDTHLLTVCRVAIDVDTGRLLFYSVIEDRWLSHDEWRQTGWWT